MKLKDVQITLKQLNVTPNKKRGQNFLIDDNIVQKIINISEITNTDTILEIGPGLGALTEELIKNAEKVICVEIESKFFSYLTDKYSIYNNIEIISGDILKVDIPDHDKVVSNIPYTITGPILERIFFKSNSPIGVLTIEKSLAERIFNIKEYKKLSRIGVGTNSFSIPLSKFEISRNSFYPIPKIDLSLIKIIPKKDLDSLLFQSDFRNFYLQFIAGIMPYKNKNIINALEHFISNIKKIQLTREIISNLLQGNNIDNKKVFIFTIDELLELSKLFYLQCK